MWRHALESRRLVRGVILSIAECSIANYNLKMTTLLVILNHNLQIGAFCCVVHSTVSYQWQRKVYFFTDIFITQLNHLPRSVSGVNSNSILFHHIPCADYHCSDSVGESFLWIFPSQAAVVLFSICTWTFCTIGYGGSTVYCLSLDVCSVILSQACYLWDTSFTL